MNKARRKRSTLLVVDDHEDNIKVLANILSFMGYDLIPAMDARQAFARLEHSKPDLILLDIILPDMDGIAVCQELQKSPELAEIPVIFLSAADDKNLIVKALESGGVDYITKPFNKAELISRVRTHLALKQARDNLAEVAADKDELVRMLAHDFKNHVAGVQMGASLLLERADSEGLGDRSRKLISNLHESSARMLAFMRTFLANQAGANTRNMPEELDLAALAAQIAGELEPLATAKQIHVDIANPADSCTAQADRESVGRVLENLISNAIKFNPPGGKVRVTFSRDAERRVTMRIADTGPGFRPEDRDRLFQRYARLSAQPTGGEPSTGLGLFIVKKTMTELGGSVELEDGDGATFRLTFPAAPPPTPTD